MKAKPVIPRAVAVRDVEAAINHYLEEGSEQAALEFVDALEQAYAHIGRHPASGSPRYIDTTTRPAFAAEPVGATKHRPSAA